MQSLRIRSGFTLIELVIVIAIIGILAAVAIPRFINVSTSAQTAAVQAVAGALSAANANNRAARSLSTLLGAAVNNCQDVAALLQGGLPTNYTITSLAIPSGQTVTCTVTGPSSATATFSGSQMS